jgi:hypothetical protein
MTLKELQLLTDVADTNHYVMLTLLEQATAARGDVTDQAIAFTKRAMEADSRGDNDAARRLEQMAGEAQATSILMGSRIEDMEQRRQKLDAQRRRLRDLVASIIERN